MDPVYTQTPLEHFHPAPRLSGSAPQGTELSTRVGVGDGDEMLPELHIVAPMWPLG